MSEKAVSLLTLWMEYTKHINSPELYRKWSGISMISAALQRRGWVFTYGSNLYPNLYIAAVGVPGIGKTEVTGRAREIMAEIDNIHLAPSSVSKAALVDELAASDVVVTVPGKVIVYNSLYIVSNELGVLIPAYENEFMATLTDLYDGKIYDEKKRTAKTEIYIPRPQLNFFAACTPDYLRDTLPEGAWGQGFLSRMIMIFSDEVELRSLFSARKDNDNLRGEIVARLTELSQSFGEYKFTESAMRAIDTWHLGGQEPRPEHPNLAHYNTRRTAHVLKLSQVFAASEGPARLLETRHIEEAISTICNAERSMNGIFLAMSSGGDSTIINDALYTMQQMHKQTGDPIPHRILYSFLLKRTPAYTVDKIITAMIAAGDLRKQTGAKGDEYIPRLT